MLHTASRPPAPPAVVPCAPGFAALALMALVAGCGNSGEPPAPPPPEVGVVVVKEQPIPLDLTYMARTAGVREVEVRARVGGILLERLYEEGARVRENALLFRIDPAPYRAEVAQARAQVGIAKAQFEEARRERDRVAPLLARGLVSRREHDQALAAFESAEAAKAAAEAALRRAELDLSYTEVRAPIAGLTSRERRSEGSLVAVEGDSNLLTRIVQTDPLYIEFSLPASEAALVRSALGQEGVYVSALGADGKPLPQTAKLTFIDTAVDASSGTVRARATLPNPQNGLLPGQFLRARIEGVTLPKSVSIPVRGVLRSPMGAMVWVVGEGDKVEPRPVELGDTVGNQVTVVAGLKPGERVIVDGVIKVQPEAVVRAVPARTEADRPEAAGPAKSLAPAARKTPPPQDKG